MPSPRRSLALCTFVLLSCLLHAQNFFQKTYDLQSDYASGLAVFPDGKMMLAGSTDLFPLSEIDYPMIQYVNAMGDVLWTKSYPLENHANFNDIVIAGDDNLLLAWTGQDHSGWMKVDPDGNVLWVKYVSGFGQQETGFSRIIPLHDGNYLILGLLKSANNFLNPTLVKIDENGNRIWSNQLDIEGIARIQGCYEDANGFLYCAGSQSFDPNQNDGFLAKFSPGGALVGPVRFFSSPNGYDGMTQVTATTQDRLLLTGYSKGFSNGDLQLWLTEVDGAGAVRWSKTYAIAGKDLVPTDLLHLPGDQFLMAVNEDPGALGSTAIFFKIDLSGDLVLLANRYQTNGESDVLSRLRPTSNGFAACGLAKRNGDPDVWLLRTDANGDIPGCCPMPLTLQIKNVTPEVDTRVPAESANHTILDLPDPDPQENTAETRTPCFLVNTDFTLSADTVCPGECVQITLPDPTPGATYGISFSGGQPDPVVTGKICYPDAGTFSITRTAQTGACAQSTTHSVLVSSSAGRQTPNAFSPDNDGMNDRFKLIFDCPPTTFLMRVYSRWGEIVYEGLNPEEGWDGTVNGNPASSDVYIWTATVDGVENHGEVTLLR